MEFAKPGDLVLSSEVYSHVVNGKVRSEVCDHCLIRPGIYSEIQPVSILRRCSSCQIVYFCSRECQKSSWKEHKVECAYLKKISPRIPPDTVRLMIRVLLKLDKGGMHGETLPDGTLRRFSDLLTHETEILKCPKRSEAFQHFLQLVEICFSKEKFQPTLVFQVYCRILINSVDITDDMQESVGTGLYLALSAVDHSCKPNVNAIFNGRTVELKALEPIPAPWFDNCRISYLAPVLPRDERRKVLQDQYYFKCECSYCSTDTPRIEPSLLCPNCDTSILLSSETCDKCKITLTIDRIKDYYSWSDQAQQLLAQNAPDSEIFEAFLSGVKLCGTNDNVMLKVSEETWKRALNLGDMDLCVEGLKQMLPLQRLYYPENSILLWNSLALLSKAFFSLERVEEGRTYFAEALSILKLSYGEEHNLHKYMLSYVL